MFSSKLNDPPDQLIVLLQLHSYASFHTCRTCAGLHQYQDALKLGFAFILPWTPSFRVCVNALCQFSNLAVTSCVIRAVKQARVLSYRAKAFYYRGSRPLLKYDVFAQWMAPCCLEGNISLKAKIFKFHTLQLLFSYSLRAPPACACRA